MEIDLDLEEDASEDVEFSDHVPLVNFWISTNLICYGHLVVDKANKTKYFRLCLSDEVGTERPETDLRQTYERKMKI